MIIIQSKYDLAIIGSGTAATTVAFKVIEKYKKVLVIDQKPIGGTCALRGCDPKKVLVGVTESLESSRRFKGLGISNLNGEINWNELIKFKDSFTESMSKKIENGLIKSGIEILHGRAKFIGNNSLEVNGKTIEADKILIASGVKAENLNFPGAEYLIDNEGFLNLQNLPEKIVFIGGGYISVEFASIAKKAGSDVTIIQHSDRILKNFDNEMAEVLTEILVNSGVKVLMNTQVKGIEKTNGAYKLNLIRDNKEESITAGIVVHGAGREFDSDMGLDVANVKFSKKGVTVNEYLQSVSNPNVYAAGDSADTNGPKLTPVAIMEGSVVAKNILNGNKYKVDYTAIPTVVFSSPPLAMVGLTEDGASKLNIKFKVNKGEMTQWYNSRRRNIPKSYYKVLIDKESNKIIGAHVLCENAEEVINTFALAIKLSIDIETLLSMPFSYPSDTNDIKYMLY